MNDVFTVTLIILIVALLRRSLLSDPGVPYDARAGWEKNGFKTLAPVVVDTERPHSGRKYRAKR